MNNSPENNRPHRRNLLINLVQALRLNGITNLLLGFMPLSFQDWVTQLKVKNFLAKVGVSGLEALPTDSLQQSQRAALRYLVEKLGAENLGDYLEFGVFSGTSLGCMHTVLKELGLDHIRLFGFDSFEGMPAIASTEDEGVWAPGDFKLGIEFTKGILTQKGVDWSRTFLTKGWFCNTLTPELVQQYQIKKASVIMVDCDLYSSTVDVLRFCAPFIQDEVVMYFDDWHSGDLAAKNLGEKKAFDEFLAANSQFEARPFEPMYRSNEEGRINGAAFIVSRKK
jgi:O-methyltransferase